MLREVIFYSEVYKTMRPNRVPFMLFLLILATITVSCTGANNSLSPDLNNNGATGVKGAVNQDSGRYLWSYQEISINPDTMEYEMIPVRNTQNHFNILGMLEAPTCVQCVKITSFNVAPNGHWLLDLRLTHPSTNPMFTGFDVRGIVMFNGSYTFPESGFIVSDPSLGDGAVVDPDGYTDLYSPATGTGLHGYIPGKLSNGSPSATLNGYEMFITDIPNNTRNMFVADSFATQSLEIVPPTGGFVLGYALDANWKFPTTTPVTDPAKDFPPEANCPEPWKVQAQVLPIGDGFTELGGEADLKVEVFFHTKEPALVQVEIPALFSGMVDSTTPENMQPGKFEYKPLIVNTAPAAPGEYPGMVLVTTGDGDVAYQLISVTVNDSTVVKQDPIAMASANPLTQDVGVNILFSDNGSNDPDGGNIVSFEWDFENDGTYDDTGANVNHSYSSPGVYDVQMRVTDDEGATDTLDTPLQVTINEIVVDQPPVALALASPTTQEAGVAVNFFDDGSFDPDGGNIVTYEWDWNNDGTFDEQGSNVNHIFETAGIYNVQFRVTDDESSMDTLDSPLVITINEVQTQITWDNTMGQVFANRCSPCHITSSAGGKNYSTYQNFIDSDVAIPGEPDNSDVYKKIKDGTHFGQMTSEELGWLYDWILNGLAEN